MYRSGPWDIRDMRTSEEIEQDAAAKKRPSLKTLRKLRSKEASGKTVPAGTIVVKDWPALPTGELHWFHLELEFEHWIHQQPVCC